MPRQRKAAPTKRPGSQPAGTTPDRPGGYYRLLFDVFLLFHVTRRVLGDALAGTGLTAEDFALYSLVLLEGAVTPGDLTRWTGLRATTISSMLGRIVARGDMVRQRHPTDARSYHLDLTPAGREKVQRALSMVWPFMDEIDGHLGGAEWRYRLHLQDVDTVLREVGGLPPRPYHLKRRPPRRQPVPPSWANERAPAPALSPVRGRDSAATAS